MKATIICNSKITNRLLNDKSPLSFLIIHFLKSTQKSTFVGRCSLENGSNRISNKRKEATFSNSNNEMSFWVSSRTSLSMSWTALLVHHSHPLSTTQTWLTIRRRSSFIGTAKASCTNMGTGTELKSAKKSIKILWPYKQQGTETMCAHEMIGCVGYCQVILN